MTNNAAGYIDGFDPSGPLQYSTSNFWELIIGGSLAAVLTGAILWVLVTFATLSKRLPAACSITLTVLMTSGFMFVALDSPRYDARTEASKWAEQRYGIFLNPNDAKELFSDFECQSSFDSNRVCTNQILNQHGEVITAKYLNGKIILIESPKQPSELTINSTGHEIRSRLCQS